MKIKKDTPFFIAEVSSNHNSNLKRCLKFIDTAKDIGCDAVKFQLFKIDQLFHSSILKKRRDIKNRKKWELPISFIKKISQHCKKRKILFGCTPFYLEGVDLLDKYVDFFKIASYELLWDELFIKCIKKKKHIIFSTGMATGAEIKKKLKLFKKFNFKNYSILHCVSSYPAPINSVNLNSINYLKKLTKNKINIGWSDHTNEDAIIYNAIFAYDAKIIEFHLDIDKKGKEFHFNHCWLPHRIKKIIKISRQKKEISGKNYKIISNTEKIERDWRADRSDGLRPLKKLRK
jgi:sialic acid synthase SpsE